MENSERNIMLVERFGDLERICNQIYGDHHGVTCYIEDMKALGIRAAYTVPGWTQSLERLQEIRHKRNMLTHGEVSFSRPWAEQQDISFLEAFRERILTRTDPLAVYREIMEEEREKAAVKQQNAPIRQQTEPKRQTGTSRRQGCSPVVLVMLLVVGILLLFMLLARIK